MKMQKMREMMAAVVAIMGATFLPVAHASDWDTVVAFYPFDDQAAGANAAGATVENMIDSSVGPGTVSNGNGTGATATFDSEGPGTYVYSSSAATVPAYTNPASLHLTADSSVRGSAGSILFGNLGNVLASSPGNHTFEYFFKMDDAAFGQCLTHLNMWGGYLFSDGTEQALNLYMPFADGSDSGRQFRYSIKYYDGNRTATQTLTYNLWDGKWHHVAVVATNSKVQVWVDYKQYGSVTVDGTRSSTATRNIKLGGALHARYSCVRVSSRALGVDGFMRAVNQLPVSMGEDTAAFYPFNEYPSDVEATAATVRNVCSPLLGEGKVSNGADATAQATFDSDAPGKYVFFRYGSAQRPCLYESRIAASYS